MIPALLTRMSTPPNALDTATTAASIDAGSPTSKATPSAVPPSSLATASALACSRPQTATLAPAWTSACAMARPIPRVLPVTSAVLPDRSMLKLIVRSPKCEVRGSGGQESLDLIGGAEGRGA